MYIKILFLLGVVAYDLIGVLKIFNKEKWLSSEEYNKRLRHEFYEQCEKSSVFKFIPILF
jgi:hypothetical protein